VHNVTKLYQISDEGAGDVFPGCIRQVFTLMPVEKVECVLVYSGVQTQQKRSVSHPPDCVTVHESNSAENFYNHVFVTIETNSPQR
jgi:hypothetical protein